MLENQPEIQREFGPQPLDELLTRRSISNRDLVAASSEQITHKMVTRGRKGRLLTRNVQRKLLNALNNLSDEPYSLEDLFNYRGK